MPDSGAVNGARHDVEDEQRRISAEDSTPYLRPSSPNDASREASGTAYLAAVFRKLDWRLLPVFFLLNMLNYLDRANLAFASINMSQDLGLTSEGPCQSV